MAVVVDSGVKDAKAVTPSDANTFEDDFGADREVSKGILIGTGGDVACQFADGASSIILSLDAGYHPFRLRQILSTGTTASGIVALF